MENQSTSLLILGSSSPRRRELLTSTGIPFEIISPSGEIEDGSGWAPADFVLENAKIKAQSINRPDHAVVIGADTVVYQGDKIFGKPHTAERAEQMLAELADQWHRVFTGVWLEGPSGKTISFGVETKVKLRPMAEGVRRSYVATAEPLDKAGSYAIQGKGCALVERIEGSYSNVVGLPLAEVVQHLTADFGFSLFSS